MSQDPNQDPNTHRGATNLPNRLPTNSSPTARFFREAFFLKLPVPAEPGLIRRVTMADAMFQSDEDLVDLLRNSDAAVDMRGNQASRSNSMRDEEDDELRTVSRSSSSSFFIEAESLGCPSPRPRHLETRIDTRSPLLYSAESNRAAFLENRRSSPAQPAPPRQRTVFQARLAQPEAARSRT